MFSICGQWSLLSATRGGSLFMWKQCMTTVGLGAPSEEEWVVEACVMEWIIINSYGILHENVKLTLLSWIIGQLIIILTHQKNQTTLSSRRNSTFYILVFFLQICFQSLGNEVSYRHQRWISVYVETLETQKKNIISLRMFKGRQNKN